MTGWPQDINVFNVGDLCSSLESTPILVPSWLQSPQVLSSGCGFGDSRPQFSKSTVHSSVWWLRKDQVWRQRTNLICATVSNNSFKVQLQNLLLNARFRSKRGCSGFSLRITSYCALETSELYGPCPRPEAKPEAGPRRWRRDRCHGGRYCQGTPLRDFAASPCLPHSFSYLQTAPVTTKPKPATKGKLAAKPAKVWFRWEWIIPHCQRKREENEDDDEEEIEVATKKRKVSANGKKKAQVTKVEKVIKETKKIATVKKEVVRKETKKATKKSTITVKTEVFYWFWAVNSNFRSK